MRSVLLPSGTRSAVGTTIALRIRISRFGDASGRCSAFEVRRRCRSSAQCMPRCTTNSIRSAISSRGKSTSRDALLPWPSGALSRHRSPLARWVLDQWFSYRRRDRTKPLIGDKRPPSPLEKIQPDGWLAEYTEDLLYLLNVLGRVIALEPRQADLLDRIVAGPVVPVAAPDGGGHESGTTDDEP